MHHRVRVTEKFARQSAEQLVTMTGTIVAGLTDNPAFPDPKIDLKALQVAAEDLKAALSARALGNAALTADKRNKQQALISLLRHTKHYVEDNSKEDLAAVLSTGFQAATITRDRSPLDSPSILGIRYGSSGELVLRVTPIERARCYEVQVATIGPEGLMSPWQSAGMFTNSRAMTIPNLVSGTNYVFRVRAIGGAKGYSDWSDAVSRFSA